MRFLLYVEGKTEADALAKFLKKWLDQELSVPVRIGTVQFHGFGDYLANIVTRAPRDLDKPGSDVIAAIGLLDIYQLTMPFPAGVDAPTDRRRWAKAKIEAEVGHPKFRQFFAVHETEAWLLSDASIFPDEVRAGLSDKTQRPEDVNFQEPPGKLLERLYRTKTKRGYRKAIDGPNLFSKLAPQKALDKCPNLKALLDEMLTLARAAGIGEV